MPTKWLTCDPTPAPLPGNWGDSNVYRDCRVNGAAPTGKLHLMDQSANPPTPVTWDVFNGNPTNANWVPIYYGPTIAGQPGVAIRFEITLGTKTWKWAGFETCKWFSMGQTGYWQVTGMNYESDAYPQ